ncbi:PTS glucitol/sorbitol transporter subunit IIA [Xenorhabdus sp. Flor]|uniref:PTS glucitol/sorbitol transporter subunit IIA n=1 Tax=Xenorhabdus cabanillasii TaxID=351673 RepID=UPI0019BC97B5|nr:PTS glucitol/sorbitol transporter subunit IIA [Xenorhabdus sp. Flor]MBD2814438.1 PTS glucitol/sorbitol transporter subunit IIA [Xenorhabdus sp. Flor]
MMIIFETQITRIGSNAHNALMDNILILFREGVSADLEEYCFIHAHGDMSGELKVSGKMQLGEQIYLITAIGDVVSTNLRELGHITVHFDGNHVAELPGSVHVQGEIPEIILSGSTLKFTE